ncbi:hypothetical protein BH24DEI1_BH24DEI1_04050 [soil metagenome]
MTDNRASNGGGVRSTNNGITRTDVKGSSIVGNTLLDGTTANDVSAFATINRFNSLGYNLVGAAGDNVDFSQEFNQTGDQTNVTAAALNLGSLANNGGPTLTHALLSGSIAIDAVPTSACEQSKDQRGVTRPQGEGCDIGAFERAPDPELEPVTVSVNSRGTVSRATGAATVSGEVSCSAPTDITLDIALSQTQKQGRTTTEVTGSESITVSCDGMTPWTATVSGDFRNGAATVTVTGSEPVTQEVRLSWVR